MSQEDFALMAAVFAGTYLLASLLGLRAGNSRSDVALMGGSGVAFGVMSAFLFVS
jgi:hypothetical protein